MVNVEYVKLTAYKSILFSLSSFGYNMLLLKNTESLVIV